MPVRTGDGSMTLDSPGLGEHYHSLFGAATESRHVYVQQGLLAAGATQVDVLEVGLGTGLNALLTWQQCVQRGIQVRYWAVEPLPLPQEVWQGLGHASAMDEPDVEAVHQALMTAEAGRWLDPMDGFAFRCEHGRLQDLSCTEAFDLVYYDAFAPSIQPEMWTVDVFVRVGRAMRPGGILVTYCAKGDVRRAMQDAGLLVERLPGPPGKRQMLRATRPR